MFLSRSNKFNFLFCATAVTINHNEIKKDRIEVIDLWPPHYDNAYTEEIDDRLHDLEKQSPQGNQFRFYLHREGEWKSRFAKISKNHSIQLLIDKKEENIKDKIIGCGACAIQKIFIKMNKDNKNALTLSTALYTGDCRIAKDHRRKGYAVKMAENWRNIAKDKNIAFQYCHVLSDNKPSIKFVSKIGYKPICTIYYNVIMPSTIQYKYINDENNLLSFKINDDNKQWLYYEPNTQQKIKIEQQKIKNRTAIWKKYFSEYQFFIHGEELNDLSSLSNVFTAKYVDNEKSIATISTYRSIVNYVVLNAQISMKCLWILHALKNKNYSKLPMFIKWIIFPNTLKKDGYKMDNLVLFAHSAQNDDNNNNLLYRVLLEFIEKKAMSNNSATIAAILCERDQNTYAQYINSDDVSTEMLMVSELKSGVIDAIKSRYNQKKIVWMDPREW